MKINITNEKLSEEISKFSEYSDRLESLLNSSSIMNISEFNKNIESEIVNGTSAKVLEKLVSYKIRKENGIFFTNSVISNQLADIISSMLKKGCTIIDPACGSGNLLLSCAKYLPRGNDIEETLSIWSKLIKGYDLYTEFIKAAKLRLILLAIKFHISEIDHLLDLNYSSLFNGLIVGNSLDYLPFNETKCIVVNPPFGYSQCSPNCKWSQGKVQIAALFIESLFVNAVENQHIVAILPDVLRSGTRYRKWRDIISTYCKSIKVESIGRFDKNTDVDVFILHSIISKSIDTKMQWPKRDNNKYVHNHRVSDFFYVHVGSVVPHRDLLLGSTYNYIHAKNTPAWQILTVIKEKRKSSKTVFKPPFVVVNRTSSPSDKFRCKATIINVKQSVAVENHLLILLPRKNYLHSCTKLVKTLKSSKTNEWMNERIRCRHLTVSALKELPCSKIF
ncbi:MAG: N-6 DNA methylase [Clostridiales bacterium]|nr:N-6 DNA methylase [Clostridiales bacterium]